MLKKPFILIPILLLTICLFSFTIDHKKPVKIIIIDPGHGGLDQGADGLVSTEAQLTLAMSLQLGDLITKELPGVKVLFTRTTDVLPGNCRNKSEALRYRANFANSSKADLFISIHCNSAGRSPGGWNERRIVSYNEKVSYVGKKKRRKVTRVPVYESFYVANESKGTETFIWTAAENSHKGQFVGENGEFSGNAEDSAVVMQDNDPVMNALKLVYTKKYFLNSLRLADMVQQEFVKAGRVDRGVKQRNDVGIWVLHATGMPSILVETGFISNKIEEQYMNSEAGQQEIVKNITAAIEKYMITIDNPKKGSENEKAATPNNVAILSDEKTHNFFTPRRCNFISA